MCTHQAASRPRRTASRSSAETPAGTELAPAPPHSQPNPKKEAQAGGRSCLSPCQCRSSFKELLRISAPGVSSPPWLSAPTPKSGCQGQLNLRNLELTRRWTAQNPSAMDPNLITRLSQ